jgi:hypothetical protein
MDLVPEYVQGLVTTADMIAKCVSYNIGTSTFPIAESPCQSHSQTCPSCPQCIIDEDAPHVWFILIGTVVSSVIFALIVSYQQHKLRAAYSAVVKQLGKLHLEYGILDDALKQTNEEASFMKDELGIKVSFIAKLQHEVSQLQGRNSVLEQMLNDGVLRIQVTEKQCAELEECLLRFHGQTETETETLATSTPDAVSAEMLDSSSSSVSSTSPQGEQGEQGEDTGNEVTLDPEPHAREEMVLTSNL